MGRYRDPLTKDLFEWQPPKVAVGYGSDVAGRGHLDNRIARLVSHALRDAREDRELSRADIAASMSDWLGRSISEAMLHKWASEAATDHRIPLDAFMALVHATGCVDLLGFAPGEFDLTVIENRHAARIKLQLLKEHRDEVDAQINLLDSRQRSKR